MVGDIVLNKRKLEPYASHAHFTGLVTRGQVADWLAKFDVFFFPSTCEGSAGAVMEAMAAGIPIVTTRNSGSLVRDGIEGFIRPYDDIEGFEQAIHMFDDDRHLMLQMGHAARQRILQWDLATYQASLIQMLTSRI